MKMAPQPPCCCWQPATHNCDGSQLVHHTPQVIYISFNMFGRYTDYAYEPEKRRYRDLLSYSLYPAVYDEFRCGV